MGLLVPAAALFGLTVPAIIVLYLLKKKRLDVEVSSSMLWEQVLRDVSASTPWQKLKRNLLLYLQIAAALALAASLMRPYFSRLAGGSSSVVAIIDVSASMRATDGSPTRFDDAIAAARGLARSLGRKDEMAVVAAGASPSLVVPFTGDRSSLENGLSGLAAGYSEADLGAALSLAASMLENKPEPEIVVISDGVVRPVGAGSRNLAGRVRWLKVGKADDNTAILALSTRTGGAGQIGLVRVAHYGKAPYRGTLIIQGDGKPLDRREIELPGSGGGAPGAATGTTGAGGSAGSAGSAGPTMGTTQDIVFDIPSGVRLVSAEITGGGVLAEDDRAWAVVGVRQEAKVLLVSKGNVFLEKSLSLRPGAQVFRAQPPGDAATPLPGGYDLYVLDGFWPAVMPAAPVLAISPPAGSTLVAGAPVAVSNVTASRADEPITRFVDLGQVHVRAATPVRATGTGLSAIIDSPEAPLLLTGTREGRRFGLFTFDLHYSDLPLRPAFPVLMLNLTGWLLGDAGEGGDLAPGTVLPVRPVADARSVRVTAPDGHVTQIAPPFPPSTYVVQAPGAYRVVQELAGGAGGAAGSGGSGAGGSSGSGTGGGTATTVKVESIYTVNERSPLEAAIAPADRLPLPGDGSSAAAPAARAAVQHEAWPYLAWLALALLATEWWVFARGL